MIVGQRPSARITRMAWNVGNVGVSIRKNDGTCVKKLMVTYDCGRIDLNKTQPVRLAS